MKTKIIFYLALSLIGGLSAFGDSVEFPVTPKSLEQGRFVFSISTNPTQTGVSIHVTIRATTGGMPSDGNVGFSIITSSHGVISMEPVKAKPQVTLQKDSHIWKADVAASSDLLKNPDIYMVFSVLGRNGMGDPMPSVEFYQIRLRDFVAP